MAEGRVCGGRKLQANLAKFSPNIKTRSGEESSLRDWKNFRQSSFWHEEHHMGEVQDQRSKQEEEERLAGWIVEDDTGKGVRVAQWVVKEQKRSLFNSLVGFLKATVSIEQIESWIYKCCGQLPLNLQKLEEQVVWMQLSSTSEVDDFLRNIAAMGGSSPFSMIERWMEVLGSPPNSIWVTVKGVPLQPWHEGVFRLIGDCVGKTMEIDARTREKKVLTEGRVQVLLNSSTILPLQVPIWADDLKFKVFVEEEEDNLEKEKARQGMRRKEQKEVHKAQQGLRKEDDDVSSPISNFKSSACSMEKFGPVSNKVIMDQDGHLGCNSLKTRGLLRVGPGGSDTTDKCFKGLGLISRANVEIEEDLEHSPSKAKEWRHGSTRGISLTKEISPMSRQLHPREAPSMGKRASRQSRTYGL
eukprot:TRINITY_DN13823_c0_g2_i8.p1 TRINITY_DN13823_c0_g2~~TRINITY_DN13823_c0_g2_i8.p1  ORF type:complete len:414 (+),score=87.35 TRINITY_DN13823_c0_g2_i8:1496-2737(+)